MRISKFVKGETLGHAMLCQIVNTLTQSGGINSGCQQTTSDGH